MIKIMSLMQSAI